MKRKLPTAQQLPSGIYRCQVMVDAQRVSVTDPNADRCQAKVVALKNGLIKQTKLSSDTTLAEAIDRYISERSNP